MGSYKVRRMYAPAAGLGAATATIDPRSMLLAQASPSMAQSVSNMGTVALVGAVAGVGLLAYLAAKALK